MPFERCECITKILISKFSIFSTMFPLLLLGFVLSYFETMAFAYVQQKLENRLLCEAIHLAASIQAIFL